MSTFFDELENDPEFAKAMERERQRWERSYTRACPFGKCSVQIDPADNTIMGGFGEVGCGCDSLPGWRSKHYDGLPKPGWKGKAVGRHGGRIAASRRKHAALKKWQADIDALINLGDTKESA